MALINKQNWWKVGLLSILIIATGAWAISTWRSFRGGLDRPVMADPYGTPPTEAQASQFRKRVMDELNLSWSQQWELAKIQATGRPQTPYEFADRLNQMQDVLTPEQRRVAEDLLEDRFARNLQRRLEKADRVLPPDQFDIFEDRLQRNVRDFRSRINQPSREGQPQ